MPLPTTRPPRRFPLAVLLLAAAMAHAQPPPPLYRDPHQTVEARVQDLLRRMTLEEKVAQLQEYHSTDPTLWDKDGIFTGGKDPAALGRGAGTVLAIDNDLFRTDLRLAVVRTNSLQKFMREKTRLGIPVLSYAESLHGFMAAGATSFPQAIALGSTWDPALVEQVFTVASREASARGVRQVLGPVLDLAREPRWGRFEECYGEDPYLVSRIALAAIRGLQGRGPKIDSDHVAVTLKHFAGHGQPEGGRNIAPVDYGEREFRSDPLYPFEVAVKVGHAHAVMASYNEWDGVPNHVSHKLLTEILRREWGFDGLVMSDGGGVNVVYHDHHAAASLAEAGVLCLEAGVDYDLDDREWCFATLAEEERAGQVSPAAIDRAAANILRVKFLCGLFDHPYRDPAAVENLTHTPADQMLARHAAEEALILLKNQDHILPFDAAKLKTLAVIGPNAADIHLGGYAAVPMVGVSVLQGIKDFVGGAVQVRYAEGCKLTTNHASGWLASGNPLISDPAADAPLIAAAVEVARHCDAVVLVLGENELLRREAWNSTHLGDHDNLDLVGRQRELAEAIFATGKPVAVLLINGAPLTVNDLQAHAPALLECWYLGEQTGPAVADVLFGKVSPSGKLTVTLPRSVGQLPDYYDHQPSRFRDYVLADSTPLYPFGFGLSYTTFAYRNLHVSPATIGPGGSAQVSVMVTNSGAVPADEIVQLYLHAVVSLPVRPVEELKDFARVSLRPGETQSVTFQLTPDKLAALGLNFERTVQPGDFEILVGGSSVNAQKVMLKVAP